MHLISVDQGCGHGPSEFGRTVDHLHGRNSISIRVPPPNDNLTMAMGSKVLADAVFSDLGLDKFLDGLKRDRGGKVSKVAIALAADSAEMSGTSIGRLDRIMGDGRVREEYGPGGSASRSVYRTVERIGRNSDEIVRFFGEELKKRYGVR